ncbi:laminin subunit beta-3 [Arapaima gigas]
MRREWWLRGKACLSGLVLTHIVSLTARSASQYKKTSSSGGHLDFWIASKTKVLHTLTKERICFSGINEDLDSDPTSSSSCSLWCTAELPIWKLLPSYSVGQWRMKCCPCDSRNPSSLNAHTIQNVLSSARPTRWWQSQKGVSPVTLQLDLPNIFQLDTLALDFKGPRPSALVIERSTDFGKTWQPALYMAVDCSSAFPHVRTALPHNLQETYCFPLPPLPSNPYKDQTIYFSPLRQFSALTDPLSRKVEVASGFTNLRVNLTQLGQVPHTTGRSPSLYYALNEMRVMGSCFCHGHASQCLSDTSTNELPSTQVGPMCKCQHNTAGVNCERCMDLYNDLPWRPAEDGQTHTCKRCECNNHAQRCRFDPVLYMGSGHRSGGVCEDCLHNTAGRHCDRCAPNYYRNPRSAMNRPDACLSCQCSAAGAEKAQQCDEETGRCRCKANVEGPQCDHCKSGYYGLSADNPLGCSKCPCDFNGTCDSWTGQCNCPPNVLGVACDRCAPNHWNFHASKGCVPCNCDPNNSYGTSCDQLTGQCQCRPRFGGQSCTECPDGTYGDPRTGCWPCKCDQSGTASCDKHTGACNCLLGVMGSRCDTCARGHCNRYPVCPLCPACFFTLDQQLQNLTINLEGLSSRASALPGTIHPGLASRIQAMENGLTQIRGSMMLPPQSAYHMNEVVAELQRLRDQAERLDPSTFTTYQVLAHQLDELDRIMQSMTLEYNDKKEVMERNSATNYKGAFLAIETAYKDSNAAMKAAEASKKLQEQAAGLRRDALALEERVQHTNTKNLEQLDKELATEPNLTPAAKQVCGSTRSTPCTPQQCDGELCPAPEDAACTGQQPCIGALPLGTKALGDSKEVNSRLQQLTKKIAQTAEQIQKTQDSANKVRLTADDLTRQIKQARDTLEADMQNTRDYIKDLRNFLSDPLSDPAVIQTISEGVLNTKLPLSLATLKRKVEDIRTLAAGLPDSSRILASTTPQLDLARQLLLKAQTARDDALEVGNRVDSVLGNLSNTEVVLNDLETTIQNSLVQLKNAENNIAEAEKKLDPALKTVEEVTGLVGTMQPQLQDLKALVQSTGQLAAQAHNQAQDAQKEVSAAAQDLPALEKQLELLKEKANVKDGGRNEGEAGDRLQKLQLEASALIEGTMDMMKSLTGREASLQHTADQLLQKAQMLESLDAEVQSLLGDIRRKATVLSTCQG